MEYRVHEIKKSLKKNRIQLLIGCVVAFAVIALIIGVSGNESHSEAEGEMKEPGNLRRSEDSKESNPESSESGKPIPTTTTKNFEVIKTHIRPGTVQYYT